MTNNYKHKYLKYYSKLKIVQNNDVTDNITEYVPPTKGQTQQVYAEGYINTPKESRARWSATQSNQPQSRWSSTGSNQPQSKWSSTGSQTNILSTSKKKSKKNLERKLSFTIDKLLYDEIMNSDQLDNITISNYIDKAMNNIVSTKSSKYSYQASGKIYTLEMGDIINENIKNLIKKTSDGKKLSENLAVPLLNLEKEKIALCISLFGAQLYLIKQYLGHPKFSIQLMVLDEYINTSNISKDDQLV